MPAPAAVDPRILAARKLPGSINLCIGPGNCGKTDFAMRMSLLSAALHNVQWYGYDSGGDASKHFDSIVSYYQLVIEMARAAVRLRRTDSATDEADARAAYETFALVTGTYSHRNLPRSLRDAWLNPAGDDAQATPPAWAELRGKFRAVWLDPRGQDAGARNRLRFISARRQAIFDGPSTLPRLIRTMVGWIDDSRERARMKQPLVRPRAVVFIDEAGAVRGEDELFWEAMRQARNAGVTLWTAGHRFTDLRPAALAVSRNKILWRPTDRSYVEVAKGVRIPAEKLTAHQSDVIKYVVGDEYTNIRTWDREKDYARYPAELITPAWPTVGRMEGI